MTAVSDRRLLYERKTWSKCIDRQAGKEGRKPVVQHSCFSRRPPFRSQLRYIFYCLIYQSQNRALIDRLRDLLRLAMAIDGHRTTYQVLWCIMYIDGQLAQNLAPGNGRRWTRFSICLVGKAIRLAVFPVYCGNNRLLLPCFQFYRRRKYSLVVYCSRQCASIDFPNNILSKK